MGKLSKDVTTLPMIERMTFVELNKRASDRPKLYRGTHRQYRYRLSYTDIGITATMFVRPWDLCELGLRYGRDVWTLNVIS